MNSTKTAVEIIKESIKVDESGNVSFRSRTGRGSGAGIDIPGAQFDEFVRVVLETQKTRQNGK